MKTLFCFLFLFCLVKPCLAQTVNQVSFLPANPDESDTVYVITDFSYNGACSFGMVYNYVSVNADTIFAMPTYCGYGQPTPCNSIDTFALGIFSAGNYVVNIEFHQGSVCPISGFDATLTSYQTTLTVNTISGVDENRSSGGITIYPVPAKNELNILLPVTSSNVEYRIHSATGQIVSEGIFTSLLNKIRTDTNLFSSGIYFLETFLPKGSHIQKFIIE